jgi:hypothetical protein
LPPRPEPTPTLPPTSPALPKPQPVGGFIELQASFSDTWPWDTVPRRELWTVVQWQDAFGNWHDVEGWQGTLDDVKDKTGAKRWWVAPSELGKGPFRWAVYRSQGGRLLVRSDPFDLPAASGETVAVDVALEP